MKNKDRFAAIAATEVNGENKGLAVPRTRKTEGLFLDLRRGRAAGWTLAWDSRSEAEQLEEARVRLRAHYQPFLAECAPALESFRRRVSLDEFQWRVATAADRRSFDGVLAGDGRWERVTIPHYQGPLGYAETIYRAEFHLEDLPAGDEAAFFCFRGVDYIAHVYLNNRLLGSHEGFFAPFEFDCTEVLRRGKNVLTVCVENDFTHEGSEKKPGGELFSGDKIYGATGPGWDNPDTGWYHDPAGMGIYQPVYLEIRKRAFVSDIYVRPVPGDRMIETEIGVYSCDVAKKGLWFEISVYGKNHDETVAEGIEFVPYAQEIQHGEVFRQALSVFGEGDSDKAKERIPLLVERGANVFHTSVAMPRFRWWTPREPWLYEIQIRLLDGDGRLLDTARKSFGMRTFEMGEDPESGLEGQLFLNGERIRLRGAGTMGFDQLDIMQGRPDQLVEDVLLAKAANLNFFRLTQRPIQEEAYDIFDRLGMLVQTDLPLFGTLRRNKYIEALRQTEDMELFIRSHPSCIMISYINEPAPNLRDRPHRYASREELSAFFDMADQVVHMHNPDRVIKHVEGDFDPPRKTIQDYHCYTGWYNGFGIDMGALNKGDWMLSRPGWYYTCGEYGAEGMESEAHMRRHYPPEWLPHTAEEEAVWNPSVIPGCQSGGQHYMFYETPHSLAEWEARGQEYQAEATKWMTEAFRRDSRMVSIVIFHFMDQFPACWMKALIDSDRTPKKALYAYRNAIAPVMVSLRADRFSYFTGEEAGVEFWLCSDRPEAVPVRLQYEVDLPNGEILTGEMDCVGRACAPLCVGELRFPVSEAAGTATVKTALLSPEGKLLHNNAMELRIDRRLTSAPAPVIWIPEADGKSSGLSEFKAFAQEAGVVCDGPEAADWALCPDAASYEANRAQIDAFISGGGRLLLLNLPAGVYDFCGRRLCVRDVFMMPRHFVSRDTGHRAVAGFDRKSFRYWYDEALDRISPILASTLEAEGMLPILKSGNADDQGNWHEAIAAGELKLGQGSIVVCQIELRNRIHTNPVAWNFVQQLLSTGENRRPHVG